MNYLTDTSALVRILRGQAAASWDGLIERGRLALCEPVITETLTIAGAKTYGAIELRLASLHPWVPVPDGAWEVIRDMRRKLAARSAHHGVSVADYLIAATALHHGLTVLHDDTDFETVAAIIPDFRQERISG